MNCEVQPNVHRTHAAAAALPTEDWKARVKRGRTCVAAILHAGPGSVRRQDQLVAKGMEREAVHRQALKEAGA